MISLAEKAALSSMTKVILNKRDRRLKKGKGGGGGCSTVMITARGGGGESEREKPPKIKKNIKKSPANTSP